MALQEVIEEIRSSRGGVEPEKKNDSAEKKPRKKREMTPAEMEAYRQKKMREEEARYLRAEGKKNVSHKKETSRKDAREMKKEHHVRSSSPRKQRVLKPLQPLQPLYLLSVPGLPEGDCIAICLVHGAK